MKTIVVRPGRGRIVIDPVKNRIVPEAGTPVTYSAFWKRRLADGDAVLVPEPTDLQTPADFKET